jgi:hypothetical protein
MANIKKCDRCGRVYEKNEMPVMYGVYDSDGRVDMCDSCAQELINFVERRPEGITVGFNIPLDPVEMRARAMLDPDRCGGKYSR